MGLMNDLHEMQNVGLKRLGYILLFFGAVWFFSNVAFAEEMGSDVKAYHTELYKQLHPENKAKQLRMVLEQERAWESIQTYFFVCDAIIQNKKHPRYEWASSILGAYLEAQEAHPFDYIFQLAYMERAKGVQSPVPLNENGD